MLSALPSSLLSLALSWLDIASHAHIRRAGKEMQTACMARTASPMHVHFKWSSVVRRGSRTFYTDDVHSLWRMSPASLCLTIDEAHDDVNHVSVLKGMTHLRSSLVRLPLRSMHRALLGVSCRAVCGFERLRTLEIWGSPSFVMHLEELKQLHTLIAHEAYVTQLPPNVVNVDLLSTPITSEAAWAFTLALPSLQRLNGPNGVMGMETATRLAHSSPLLRELRVKKLLFVNCDTGEWLNTSEFARLEVLACSHVYVPALQMLCAAPSLSDLSVSLTRHGDDSLGSKMNACIYALARRLSSISLCLVDSLDALADENRARSGACTRVLRALVMDASSASLPFSVSAPAPDRLRETKADQLDEVAAYWQSVGNTAMHAALADSKAGEASLRSVSLSNAILHVDSLCALAELKRLETLQLQMCDLPCHPAEVVEAPVPKLALVRRLALVDVSGLCARLVIEACPQLRTLSAHCGGSALLSADKGASGTRSVCSTCASWEASMPGEWRCSATLQNLCEAT